MERLQAQARGDGGGGVSGGRDPSVAAGGERHPSVAVIGAGTIGVGWAVVFARAGYQARLYDTDEPRLHEAIEGVSARLKGLASAGLLDEAPELVSRRVSALARLPDALTDVLHVQECAPEDLALKRSIFAELDAQAPSAATLASSSSALSASQFAQRLRGRARCLVAHPANPPHLLPVVELVPAPFTDPVAVSSLAALLERAGMSPVRLRSEIEGFIYNRLQGAVLREAYCLVRDGVADVEDVDRVMREGLGRRWAVVGPFETADLNVRGGISAHAQRMGPAYARMGAQRGQDDPWTADLVAKVHEQRRALLDLQRWEERIAWRDRMLMSITSALRDASR